MIKHYIFDFGDVFINLDKQAPAKELQKFGLTEFTREMIEHNHLYEKGLLTTDDFIAFYWSQFPEATSAVLQNAWNSMILDFPIEKLTFIEEFSNVNSCYLLSNINDLHLEYIKGKLGSTFYNRFYNCFKKVYYSHEINLRKPDPIIFEYVFNDAKINPKECFFVDDTPENTKTARTLSIKTWRINPDYENIINLPTVLSNL